MRRCVCGLALLLAAAAAAAQEQPAATLTLAEAQPASPVAITATGRVQAAVCARVGGRVSGQLAEFGKNADGQMLDAGITRLTGINDARQAWAARQMTAAALRLRYCKISSTVLPRP